MAELSGFDNLSLYLREAVLPAMRLDPSCPQPPPAGHKSHANILHVVQEPWRRLEHMHKVCQAAFDKKICDWMDTNMPKLPMHVSDEDERTGAMLSVACVPFKVPAVRCRPPSDFDGFLAWIDTIPLMTVQRIMHVLCPQYGHWAFTRLKPASDDLDADIFRQFIWTRGKPTDPRDTYTDHRSVMVFVQPPWILSDKDLEEFGACSDFPPYYRPGHAFPAPMEAKDRLWAKVWDSCARRDCPWFVLTNYNGWVVGCFTPGWVNAHSTTVFPYDLYSPTILELLLFWLHTAMLLDDKLNMPQVSEDKILYDEEKPASLSDVITLHKEESYHILCLFPLQIPEPVRYRYKPTITIPEPEEDREYPECTPSESNWDGKSTAPSISATARWSTSMSTPDPEAHRQVSFFSAQAVNEWTTKTSAVLQAIQEEAEPDPFEDDPNFQNYPNVLQQHSTDTGRPPDFGDFTMADRFEGDWLMS